MKWIPKEGRKKGGREGEKEGTKKEGKKRKEMDSVIGVCGGKRCRLLFLHMSREQRRSADQERTVIVLLYRGRDLTLTSNIRKDRTERRNLAAVF